MPKQIPTSTSVPPTTSATITPDSQAGQVVTCTTTATVPPGAQAPSLVLTTTVTGRADVAVTATVEPTDGSADAVPANDQARAVVDVVVAAPPGTRPPGDGRLPRTGADVAPWIGVATLLMAMGTALVLGSHRRRRVAVRVPQD